MHFSKPLVKTEYGFYVAGADGITVANPRDLDGYTVATYGPSNLSTTLEARAKEVPGMRVEIEVNLSTALKKLAGGRYGAKGAVFASKAVAEHLMKKEGISGLRYAGKERDLYYFVGFPKASTPAETVERFNATLATLHGSGETAAILAKFNADVPDATSMK